jgi:Flp pilus assembly protein TadG
MLSKLKPARMAALRPRRGRRRSELGDALVEFAIVGTLFFFVMVALVSGIWFVAATSASTNAARDGARAGVARSSSCTQGNVQPKAVAAAGPFSAMTVAPTSGSDSNGSYCQVTVTYQFAPFGTSWPFSAFSITSTAKEYDN